MKMGNRAGPGIIPIDKSGKVRIRKGKKKSKRR
jgi:hypothetical protein